MTPTNKLRFVEREVELHPFYKSVNEKGEMTKATQKYRVLQQWWAPFHTFHDGYGYTSQELKGGEWRDVPLEEEK